MTQKDCYVRVLRLSLDRNSPKDISELDKRKRSLICDETNKETELPQNKKLRLYNNANNLQKLTRSHTKILECYDLNQNSILNCSQNPFEYCNQVKVDGFENIDNSRENDKWEIVHNSKSDNIITLRRQSILSEAYLNGNIECFKSVHATVNVHSNVETQPISDDVVVKKEKTEIKDCSVVIARSQLIDDLLTKRNTWKHGKDVIIDIPNNIVNNFRKRKGRKLKKVNYEQKIPCISRQKVINYLKHVIGNDNHSLPHNSSNSLGSESQNSIQDVKESCVAKLNACKSLTVVVMRSIDLTENIKNTIDLTNDKSHVNKVDGENKISDVSLALENLCHNSDISVKPFRANERALTNLQTVGRNGNILSCSNQISKKRNITDNDTSQRLLKQNFNPHNQIDFNEIVIDNSIPEVKIVKKVTKLKHKRKHKRNTKGSPKKIRDFVKIVTAAVVHANQDSEPPKRKVVSDAQNNNEIDENFNNYSNETDCEYAHLMLMKQPSNVEPMKRILNNPNLTVTFNIEEEQTTKNDSAISNENKFGNNISPKDNSTNSDAHIASKCNESTAYVYSNEHHNDNMRRKTESNQNSETGTIENNSTNKNMIKSIDFKQDGNKTVLKELNESKRNKYRITSCEANKPEKHGLTDDNHNQFKTFTFPNDDREVTNECYQTKRHTPINRDKCSERIKSKKDYPVYRTKRKYNKCKESKNDILPNRDDSRCTKSNEDIISSESINSIEHRLIENNSIKFTSPSEYNKKYNKSGTIVQNNLINKTNGCHRNMAYKKKIKFKRKRHYKSKYGIECEFDGVKNAKEQHEALNKNKDINYTFLEQGSGRNSFNELHNSKGVHFDKKLLLSAVRVIDCKRSNAHETQINNEDCTSKQNNRKRESKCITNVNLEFSVRKLRNYEAISKDDKILSLRICTK